MQAGAFGVSGGVSVNLLNRDVYWGGGKGNLTQGVGTSLLFGKLYAPELYGDARAKAVSNFLGGASFQATACYSIVCAGINKSITSSTDNPTIAYEYGFGGGVSAGVGYSDTLIKNSKP